MTDLATAYGSSWLSGRGLVGPVGVSSDELTELERLLVAAARDPAERPAFARTMMASDVYVIGTLDRPAVDGQAQAGSSMSIVTWSDEHGPITPFFTSEAALRTTLSARPGTDPRFLRLRTRNLFELVKGQRLVLNPDGPSGKFYLPNEVEALLSGNDPGLSTEVLQAQRQVLVGAAAQVPPDLPEVLARYLTQRPTVDAAHLGWIAHPDGQQGYLLVLVAGDRGAAMDGFGALQINELTGGNTVDVIVVPLGTKDHLLSRVPAFYTRQPQADAPPENRRRLFGKGR